MHVEIRLLLYFKIGRECIEVELIIDSANVREIERLCTYFPIDGVTTNPTIVVQEKLPFLPLLKEIRHVIGDERILYVQVVGATAEEMVTEARYITGEISGEIVMKIPVTREGIKAIKLLKVAGIRTLATTVYTPMSAYVAAKAGAEFVAPYVNRIDNLTGDGIKVVEEIVELFAKHQLDCKVIGASFKNVQQLQHVCLAGAYGLTAAPELIDGLLKHPSVEADVAVFKEQWMTQYGVESDRLDKTLG